MTKSGAEYNHEFLAGEDTSLGAPIWKAQEQARLMMAKELKTHLEIMSAPPEIAVSGQAK
jgi:hypothetical protein